MPLEGMEPGRRIRHDDHCDRPGTATPEKPGWSSGIAKARATLLACIASVSKSSFVTARTGS